MQIQNLMTRDIDMVEPRSAIQVAAQKMRITDVGSLPVSDGEKLLGIITDRDITVRAVAEGRDPTVTPVADVMSRDLVFCFEDQDVRDAAQLMAEHQIRRIPVLNRSNELVGMLALGDLAVDETSHRFAAKALGEISKENGS